MMCVERNWRVEERLASDQELELCMQQVDAVLPESKHVARSARGVSSSLGLRRRQQSRRDTQSQYDEYTRPFKEHGVPDPAIVPDDKGKKFAWVMPRSAYSLLLASFALAASSWSLTHMTEDLANAWTLSMLFRVLGVPLASKLGLNAASSVLPYTYVTIKSKCWHKGIRLCTKPGHSCVRKIVSYARWPRRQLWRSLHRAWESILKHFGDTCDAWSLDDAARKLQQLHRLPQNPGGDCPTCCRCFRAMGRLEGITGDAGQFFEMVDACTAIQEATELLTIFTSQCPQQFVTVKHPSKKRQVWFSSAANRFSPKTVVWTIQELFRGFAASMLCCLATVGDKVFALRCLPIGGLMSKVASSVVLGGQERWSSRGKGSNKGDQSWKSSGWSYNSGSGKGQYSWHGSNSSANEALALHLLERLGRSESSSDRDRSRHNSRRRRSSSRSKSRKSGSRDHELRELRAYREHHEAIERARAYKEAKEAEKKLRAEEFAELEARILRAIPTPQQPPAGNVPAASNPPADAISAKTKKLVEALLEDEVSCAGIHTWEEVDRKVLLPGVVTGPGHQILKDLVQCFRSGRFQAQRLIADAKIWHH
ncbi:hypothetical protein AK812_SmicGene43967 [Symbiodinium microadriaticum]|uniref:Uncharacterized protein n=1 Tax=Symbiodinium microadriaticum TaxID=2951 RepID=A0A1Q9BZN3_SYMMI|nr:hypothetical protein AK812_SmicGene43967 [Symbiodinium microadriaticum]